MAKTRTAGQQAKHDAKVKKNLAYQVDIRSTAIDGYGCHTRRLARRLADREAGVVKLPPAYPVEPIVTFFIDERRVKITQKTVRVFDNKDDKLGRFIIVPIVKVRDFIKRRVKEGRKWVEVEDATKWRKFENAKPIDHPDDWHLYADPSDWVTGVAVGLVAPLTGWLRIGMLKDYLIDDTHKELAKGRWSRPGQTLGKAA